MAKTEKQNKPAANPFDVPTAAQQLRGDELAHAMNAAAAGPTPATPLTEANSPNPPATPPDSRLHISIDGEPFSVEKGCTVSYLKREFRMGNQPLWLKNQAGGATLEADGALVIEGGEEFVFKPDAPPPVSPETPKHLLPAPYGNASRQGDEGRPFCPKHLCYLRSTGSREATTSYKCPVPGCCTAEKRARPQVTIPREPTPCPTKSCKPGPGNEGRFLEVNAALSSGSNVHLECPKCKFAVKVPNPVMAAMTKGARPRPSESYSDR